MHALKMAVFDFDGTLVDSVPAIARGIQLANEEIGIAPVSYEMAKSIIGYMTPFTVMKYRNSPTRTRRSSNNGSFMSFLPP